MQTTTMTHPSRKTKRGEAAHSDIYFMLSIFTLLYGVFLTQVI